MTISNVARAAIKGAAFKVVKARINRMPARPPRERVDQLIREEFDRRIAEYGKRRKRRGAD